MKRLMNGCWFSLLGAFFTAAPSGALAGDVKTGIDVLVENNFRQLSGKKVGVITNHSGFDRLGRRTVDLIARAPGVKLVAIFSPEHGLDGTADTAVASSSDDKTGVPIYSLYGETRRPAAEMLRGIDALVYDIQDVGARFYTYIATMGMAMEDAAPRGIEFFVLDRPNPVNGVAVEGPVQDTDQLSFIAYFPVPARYGMTIGEMARMFNAEKNLAVKLTVVEMQNWRRADWFDQTGLRWVNPSPNLRDLNSVIIHGGMNMLYTKDLSVGRATENPYEIFGAPWVEERRLASYLNDRRIAGVSFIPLRFVPRGNVFGGKECGGVFVQVLDRNRIDAGRLGIELIAALWKLYPNRFDLQATLRRVGSKKVVGALQQGIDPAQIERMYQPDIEKFRQIRAKYLIYK